MGGAFTAIPGGTEAMCANPAAMVETASPELTAVYGKLYTGLTDESKIGQGYFGFAAPVKRYLQGAAGFAWNDTRLSDAFSETTFAVSYATSVYRGLGAGLSLKYLRRSYVSDGYTALDPVFADGYSKSALGADLGFFYRPEPRYAFGLAVKNLNRPDMGLAAADRLPVEVRAGASYAMKTSLLDLDASFAGSDYTVAAGAEYSFQRRYALRMGLAAGNNSRRTVNMGLGGRFGLAEFDYSFSLPIGGISGTTGSHRLAFSFRFGPEADLQLDAELAELKRAQDKAAVQEEKIKVLQGRLDASSGQGAAPAQGQPDILKQIEALKTELEKSRAEMETIKVRPEARPAVKPAPAKPAQPAAARRTYVVKDGDTLESVASKVYGDPDRWPEIYRANTGSVGRGGEVKPGQVLVLP
jgi:LysM repeat protein